MDRRMFFKGLVKSVLSGAALSTSQIAGANLLGLNRYAEMVRLQQDVIAFHLAIQDRMIMQGSTLHDNPSYREHMTNKMNHLLGYSMDNFTGDATSQIAIDECCKVFNDRNYADTMSEEGLQRLVEVIVPVAVARNLLTQHRVFFSPSNMKNWDRFVDKYKALILAA